MNSMYTYSGIGFLFGNTKVFYPQEKQVSRFFMHRCLILRTPDCCGVLFSNQFSRDLWNLLSFTLNYIRYTRIYCQNQYFCRKCKSKYGESFEHKPAHRYSGFKYLNSLNVSGVYITGFWALRSIFSWNEFNV